MEGPTTYEESVEVMMIALRQLCEHRQREHTHVSEGARPSKHEVSRGSCVLFYVSTSHVHHYDGCGCKTVLAGKLLLLGLNVHSNLLWLIRDGGKWGG